MTVREYLDRARRRAMLMSFGSWLLIPLGVLGLQASRAFVAVVVAGFAGFFASIFYQLVGVRCPRCNESLGYALRWPYAPFRISHKIRFCQCCGVRFESQIPPDGTSWTDPGVFD